MSNVIRISDYHYPWEKIFHDDSDDTTVSIYINKTTKELEVLIFNDEMECIRKVISKVNSIALARVIATTHN